MAIIAKGKKMKIRVNGMKSKENPKTVNKKRRRTYIDTLVAVAAKKILIREGA